MIKRLNKKQFYILFLLFITTVISSCGNDSTPTKCKYGSPQLIFSSSDNFIKEQSHQLGEIEGEETVVFDNGLRLNLLQSGCNTIEQELQFTNYTFVTQSEQNIFKNAIALLDYMGNLKEEVKAFSFWAGAIAENLDAFQPSQEVELAPNTYAKIDKIGQGEAAMIRVILSQK